MYSKAVDSDRLALRSIAFELSAKQLEMVSGGVETDRCEWNATTTDANHDHTVDDCDL